MERVTAFEIHIYLGSLITTTVNTEEDVETRNRKAQGEGSILRSTLRSKLTSNLKSVLLYGSETWRLTKRIIANRRYWYILGVWWQHTSRRELKLPYGDGNKDGSATALRKPATHITRLSLEWNPQGAKRKGRPKKSWRKTVQQEHEDLLGMSWNQVKWTAKKQIR